MQFKQFAEFLDSIEQLSGRNEMVIALSDFLTKLEPEDIAPVMYLMQGRLLPNYIDLEFGVSQKLALRALEQICGEGESVTKIFSETGDVGLVAEKIRADIKDKPASLSVAEVYDQLMQIAKATGKGSQDAKQQGLIKLIQDLDPISARYVSRVIIGNLRLGLSDKTVLDALSWAKVGDKSLRKHLDIAYGSRADIGDLAQMVLKANGDVEKKLDNISLEPGTPVASKLVERESSAEAVFERMGRCLVQPKLDGLRCQIHLLEKPNAAGNRVEIFSRNMESLTAVFPDIVEAVQKLPAKSLIIDSEAIGYDLENETYLPFQQTIQRRRKYDIEATAEAIPIRSMAFDVIYLDGKDISREPLESRVEKLEKLLKSGKQNVIQQLETKIMETGEELDAYFRDKIGQGLEGVIIKKLGTTYDPGTRNFDWIKLKANTQSELVDTIDCVVLGYFYGRGVRAQFGVGALLLGLYKPDDEKFYSVAKVGTGMTEEQLKTIKQDLTPLEIKEKPENVVAEKILFPDVWVKPEIVTEIDADEITRSPGHTAGRGIKASFEKEIPVDKGLSLRFPRMKVWKRDKQATQSTTVAELIRLFELRKSK